VLFHFAQAETPCAPGCSGDGMGWNASFLSHSVDCAGSHSKKFCDLLGGNKRFHLSQY
jgi:hypothetical protein